MLVNLHFRLHCKNGVMPLKAYYCLRPALNCRGLTCYIPHYCVGPHSASFLCFQTLLKKSPISLWMPVWMPHLLTERDVTGDTCSCFSKTSNRLSSEWTKKWLQHLLISPFEYVDSTTYSSTRKHDLSPERTAEDLSLSSATAGQNIFNWHCQLLEFVLASYYLHNWEDSTYSGCDFHLLSIKFSVISWVRWWMSRGTGWQWNWHWFANPN